jgi:hypothetical protein
MWTCRTVEIMCCTLQLGLLIVNLKTQSANLGSRGAWIVLLLQRFVTSGRLDRSKLYELNNYRGHADSRGAWDRQVLPLELHPLFVIMQRVAVIPYDVSEQPIDVILYRQVVPKHRSTYISWRKPEVTQNPFPLTSRPRTSLWQLPRPSALQNTGAQFSTSPDKCVINSGAKWFVTVRSNYELSIKLHCTAVSSRIVRLPLFHVS